MPALTKEVKMPLRPDEINEVNKIVQDAVKKEIDAALVPIQKALNAQKEGFELALKGLAEKLKTKEEPVKDSFTKFTRKEGK